MKQLDLKNEVLCGNLLDRYETGEAFNYIGFLLVFWFWHFTRTHTLNSAYLSQAFARLTNAALNTTGRNLSAYFIIYYGKEK